MRNLVSGIIGVVLGAAWTLKALLAPPGSNGEADAYATGQFIGAIFGVVFLAAGVYYLRKGLREPR